jgi:hypothetical protein
MARLVVLTQIRSAKSAVFPVTGRRGYTNNTIFGLTKEIGSFCMSCLVFLYHDTSR